MEQKITETIEAHFPEYRVRANADDKRQTTTISAEKDWTSGFDIDIDHTSNRVAVSFSSKIRLAAFVVILALTTVLTFLFGPGMLVAMGLAAVVGDSAVTLRIAYVIPIAIFFVPSYLVTMFVAKRVNPTDTDLIERVKARLAEAGVEAVVE